jgi:hypothetical protein
MDRDAGRDTQQVLVVPGKVRQPDISVVGLDQAEGKMSSVLVIDPDAREQGKGISRRSMNPDLVGKAESKPWAKPADACTKGLTLWYKSHPSGRWCPNLN